MERLQISGASQKQTSQFKIVKSLARFNTQFKVKESFKLLLAIRVQPVRVPMLTLMLASGLA